MRLLGRFLLIFILPFPYNILRISLHIESDNNYKKGYYSTETKYRNVLFVADICLTQAATKSVDPSTTQNISQGMFVIFY